MKQKSSRGLTEKTENASERNAPAKKGKRILPEGANRKRFASGNRREADRGSHMSGLKTSPAPEDCGGRRRRTTASQEDRGGYQELQCVLPRRWVVDSTDGEHHVDGDTFSGGRRLG